MSDEQASTPDAPGSTPLRPGPMQRFRRIGVIVAVVMLVTFLGAELAMQVGPGLLGGLVRPSLAPVQAIAEVQENRDTDRLAALRGAFPRDPRVLLLSAFAAQDQAEAEQHLRAALSEKRALRDLSVDGQLEATLRSILARLLVARQADGEAREALQPSCGPQLAEIAARAGLEAGWVETACAGEAR